MIHSVKRRHNRENLVAACSALRRVAPFPFFGTLLGLTREGDIIKGDDDVDLYIDARDRDVASALLKAAGFEVVEGEWPNHTPHFLQATRILGGTKTFVDIYCYENRPESPLIIDQWNFIGRTENPEHHLCVEKDLVFPLQPKQIFGTEILLPRRPAKCCRYLYGPTWRQKISKQKGGYSVVIIENRPHILHRDSIANKLHRKSVVKAAEIERLDGRVASISAERDALAAENEILIGQRNHSATVCEAMRVERDRLATERDALATERDALATERDALATERDALATERDALATERDALATERDALATERDDVTARYESIAAERDGAVAEREAMKAQRDAAVAECDTVKVQRDEVTAQRDDAVAARDRLTVERDGAAAARDGMQRERDHAIAERDAMTTQRDHANAERDAMVAQRDHAVAEREAMAARRDSAPPETGKGMGRLFKAGNP